MSALRNGGVVRLIGKTDIREVPVPVSYLDLQTSVSAFHSAKALLKFKDTAGDIRLMTSDHDLEEALQGDSINFIVSSDEEVVSFPSTPEVLSEEEHLVDDEVLPNLPPQVAQPLIHQEIQHLLPQADNRPCHFRVTCDGCNVQPIRGTRFKCAVCPNFDFCEQCWPGNQHYHAFYSISDPLDVSHAEIIAIDTRVFDKAYKASENVLKPRTKLKLEYEADGLLAEGHTVYMGNQVYKSWKVRNVGAGKWPHGCVLGVVMGDLSIDTAAVPDLDPGECREIGVHFQVPFEPGLKSYAFRAISPDGQYFGEKLHMTIRVEPNPLY